MKGILFKPEMIRVAIERRKTNTRRAEAGLKEINQEPDKWKLTNRKSVWALGCFIFEDGEREVAIKPRYRVGEIVYIKEAYYIIATLRPDHIGFDDRVQAQSQYPRIKYWLDAAIIGVHKPRAKPIQKQGYHSPMMMPEWAARYFITITDVRAERLQEITEEDAEAEGVSWSPCGGGENPEIISAAENFADLWNSINKDYPWESNPWCFVYEFEYKED